MANRRQTFDLYSSMAFFNVGRGMDFGLNENTVGIRWTLIYLTKRDDQDAKQLEGSDGKEATQPNHMGYAC